MVTQGLSGEADVSLPTDCRSIRGDPGIMGPVAAMQFQRQGYIVVRSQLVESLDGLIDELAGELR